MRCEYCSNVHDGTYGSGRFCSKECARGFSTRDKRKDINDRVSKVLTKNHSKGLLSWDKMSYSEKRKQYRGTYSIYKRCVKCGDRGVLTMGIYCDFCRNDYWNYVRLARFRFNIYKYQDKFDLTLLDKYGWYSASNNGNNLNGISRDHMYSVKDGFLNSIDPDIVGHPANCRLIRHKLNQRKNKSSLITYEELLYRIEVW